MTILALPLLMAAAQSAFTPNSFPARRSEEETRLMYHRYGKCVAARYPEDASAAILQNLDDEELIARRRLIESDCVKLGAGMTIWVGLQADRIRYSLADALVRNELGAQAVPDLSAVPTLVHWDPGERPTPASASGKQLKKSDYDAALNRYREKYAFIQFSRFGECVVRTDPAAARSLLSTGPESRQENAAFTAIGPALANCLPGGQTMKFTKLSLRGTIAVNYYRLAKAALGSAGAAE